MVVDNSEFSPCPEQFKRDLLKKLCVLKLNGGLGTTMGCTGPKSVIQVRGNTTFLDMTVQQISQLNRQYGSEVPLILMNSFNTDEETKKVIEKYHGMNVIIESFNQSRYPRVERETLTPTANNFNGKLEDWYPPGHGDLYESFSNSGLLKKLIERGIEWVFVSNIDNLGAVVDLDILNFMEQTWQQQQQQQQQQNNNNNNNCILGSEFAMEVTQKTIADVKGGTLIDYEGKATLLEIAQVPASRVDEFKSIKKFKIFNTNNLWIRLSAIEKLVKENRIANMDVIVNMKENAQGKSVIQLERAAGAAMQFFNNAKGIKVDRTRFLPVKSCSDLLLVQSNLYSIHSDATLVMNPLRPVSSVPLIKLGDRFKKVSDYLSRFQTIPDLIELEHLTVSGDVFFGANVTLRGTVIIVANHPSRIDIPSGSILENKVITGNLRILDH
eukprot:TRINITY_DN107_c0_g1_i1.p1 TRINITY_DN107_c0_g1~~TRINITY_DN107_c0_g1_i1.p1  ORF type:complete len:440 (-),score=209.38 TRINITY_DN107_c0_g1_i1:118-1437(-)